VCHNIEQRDNKNMIYAVMLSSPLSLSPSPMESKFKSESSKLDETECR